MRAKAHEANSSERAREKNGLIFMAWWGRLDRGRRESKWKTVRRARRVRLA